MTTLKITVDNKRNATLLKQLLQSMAFIKSIETDLPKPKRSNQFEQLQNILNTIEADCLFKNIDDPVKWQKELRNEWETR